MSPRPQASGSKAAQTRARILAAALRLFRERGFDAATMRDIAAAAGLSLGAAYYHFDSKEALLLAFYEQLHEARKLHAEELFAETTDARARIVGLYHHHLEMLREDRRLLAALVRVVADPGSAASIFSPQTRSIREADMRLFRRAIEAERVSDELMALGAMGMWTLQIGLLLYFVWDDSEGEARTHELVDRTVDLLLPLLPLLSSPLGWPMVRRLYDTLESAGLIADAVREDER